MEIRFKTLPILDSISFFIILCQFVLIVRCNCMILIGLYGLYRFYLSYLMLLFLPTFLNDLIKISLSLVLSPVLLVNPLFNYFISLYFSSSIIVFTEGFVSPGSTGFSFFIPKLNIFYSDKLYSCFFILHN